MLIGIDASRAFIKNRTGIEEYSFQVIKGLMDKMKDHQVILYIRRSQKSKAQSQKLPENWKIKVIKFPYLWTQIGLSLELLFHPVDILFIPAHTVPIIHPKNTIVTIHGLEYEFCPKAYSFWERLYMRCVIKNSCRWAKTIIAVSNNTKRDLTNLYKVPEDKIEVIYEGISTSVILNEVKNLDISNKDSGFNRSGSFAEAAQDDNKKYLLFIGRLEERKNIGGIIEAFEILKEKYKLPQKLILVGKPGFGFERIKHEAESSKHKDEIIFSGFVRENEKWELLKNADIFLFPTFYEGFGLPVLEAQSAGVPVVTSNVSSIPEVTACCHAELVSASQDIPKEILKQVQDDNCSAILVNPNKPEEIAEAAYRLISDEKLRNDIINKGLENVKRFSWQKCSSDIAELLNG